jgi:hypothetical protein
MYLYILLATSPSDLAAFGRGNKHFACHLLMLVGIHYMVTVVATLLNFRLPISLRGIDRAIMVDFTWQQVGGAFVDLGLGVLDTEHLDIVDV